MSVLGRRRGTYHGSLINDIEKRSKVTDTNELLDDGEVDEAFQNMVPDLAPNAIQEGMDEGQFAYIPHVPVIPPVLATMPAVGAAPAPSAPAPAPPVPVPAGNPTLLAAAAAAAANQLPASGANAMASPGKRKRPKTMNATLLATALAQEKDDFKHFRSVFSQVALSPGFTELCGDLKADFQSIMKPLNSASKIDEIVTITEHFEFIQQCEA